MSSTHKTYIHGFLSQVTSSNISDIIDKHYVCKGIIYQIPEAREEITRALEMAYSQGYKTAMQEIYMDSLSKASSDLNLFKDDNDNEKT